MRRAGSWRPRFLIAISAIAAVFATSGVAVAVTNIHQSSPNHGKQLRGKRGKRGKRGNRGPRGPAGPATGPAGGALAGSYPNPTLNVSGGPCPSGKALVNISNLAALTCSGVSPSGAAGGDLSGSYPDPSVADGVITDANVAAANKDGTASTPSLRTLGTGAQQAMPGNATPGGPPSGAAGGALSGSYPNPTLNVSGGDSGATACKNGEALTALSTLAALTCSPGVYSDASLNVAAGPSPFGSLTTGSANVALGPSMLQNDTSGGGNVASGDAALQSVTTGFDNTASGTGALLNDTTGTFNTASGDNAMSNNISGNANTATGEAALRSSTSGNGNAALGASALGSNSTGGDNTALGEDAGLNLTGGSNNIDINNQGSQGDANTIKIGTEGTQTSTSIAGIDGEPSTNGVAVLVNGNGTLGTSASSRRYKRDIRPLAGITARLMALHPVSFFYKREYAHGGPNPLQFGLVAEQVAKLFPNLVVYDRKGRPYEVRYQELPALLLSEVQLQQRTLDRQASQIASLKTQVAQIKQQLAHRR